MAGETTTSLEIWRIFCAAAHFTAAKELLTYAKVVKVWETNGPVAAKLFTWIRNQESRTEEGVRRATYFNEYRSVTLHLPGCDSRKNQRKGISKSLSLSKDKIRTKFRAKSGSTMSIAGQT